MKELRTCEICGAALPTEQLYHFDGQDLCAQCLDNNTLFCRHCGGADLGERQRGYSRHAPVPELL